MRDTEIERFNEIRIKTWFFFFHGYLKIYQVFSLSWSDVSQELLLSFQSKSMNSHAYRSCFLVFLSQRCAAAISLSRFSLSTPSLSLLTRKKSKGRLTCYGSLAMRLVKCERMVVRKRVRRVGMNVVLVCVFDRENERERESSFPHCFLHRLILVWVAGESKQHLCLLLSAYVNNCLSTLPLTPLPLFSCPYTHTHTPSSSPTTTDNKNTPTHGWAPKS